MSLTGISKAIVELVMGVFTTVAPGLGTALVDTTETLIVNTTEAGSTLTSLAEVTLTFAAFAIGATLLYKVFGLIKFKRNSHA